MEKIYRRDVVPIMNENNSLSEEEFLDRFTSAIQQTKSNNWKDIRVEMEIEDGYDGPESKLFICGQRLETDEEFKNRLEWEKVEEESERSRYLELKQKFEGEMKC